ncbi:hypothetical protein ACGFSG_26505 [Streptomyces sp. NPDC048512]|uniref:hypothetical protein n=1 Tax=unclassified Streptomyces TaxID=2593676 RepID=UPI0009C176DA|nr:hypothetical protein [Streptomyces sp. M41(2017)]OQQ13727.1 hypothetical protein B0675_26065 [Streptomyces sp. M41(2017)]
MAALNVDFSEAELDDLRDAAREQGMTLKAFVKSSTTDAIAHQRSLKKAATEFQRAFADPSLAEAIEAAGIDDGPMASKTGRAA